MDDRCILVDLDGTLWDASATYLAADPTYRPGANVASLMLDPRRIQRALESHPPRVTQAARNWLETTRREGVKIAAVTNLPQRGAEQMVTAAGLHFDLICGVTRDVRAKPSPGMLKRALATLDIAPAAAVMVGNAQSDAVAAWRAGIRFQWVSWSEDEPPAGVSVALTWNDVGRDSPESVGRWLYKIWTEFPGEGGGLTPGNLREREVDGVTRVSWGQRIDDVEVGDPVLLWFSGQKVPEAGIYAAADVIAVDVGERAVDLLIHRLSSDQPFLSLVGADALVRTRRRQVFWYAPRSTSPCEVDDPGATSCARGGCRGCATIQQVPLIDLEHLKQPTRFRTIDSYLPAVWITARRSRAYLQGTTEPVTRSTDRFMRLKSGEVGLAQHFATLMAHQVLKSGPAWLDRRTALVPVPLDPDKREGGEEHRTLKLADALGDLFRKAQVEDVLRLTRGVGKRKMLSEGATYQEFLVAYQAALSADPLPEGISDVVLVDDTCTQGGTLECCARALRARTGFPVRVHALTAGQMTVGRAVADWSAILTEERPESPPIRSGEAAPSAQEPGAKQVMTGGPIAATTPQVTIDSPQHSYSAEHTAPFTTLPSKLVECRSSAAERTELFIVEGDSAVGTVRLARDSEFQALLPIRGRILNIQRASVSDMLSNAECASIIQVIGAGSGRSFSLESARYGKVIIMTDADVDGAYIRTLLLTLFFGYMRPLVEAGRVFFAVPPVHRIEVINPETGKDRYVYAYSDAMLRRRLGELSKRGALWKEPIQRYKGLGEMDAQQLAETTMDPHYRTLRQITVADAVAAAAVFELLMGRDVEPRRDFIIHNADRVSAERIDT